MPKKISSSQIQALRVQMDGVKTIDPSTPLGGNGSFEETIKQSVLLSRLQGCEIAK